MKRFTLVFASALAFLILPMGVNPVAAQEGGYRFGIGSSYAAGCFGGGFRTRSVSGQRPPYFALHPPVYYSHIVARPYGISPFAAPPGIMPTEMVVAPQPLKVQNPFFQPESDEPPVLAPEDSNPNDNSQSTDDKVTRIHNPHYQNASHQK